MANHSSEANGHEGRTLVCDTFSNKERQAPCASKGFLITLLVLIALIIFALVYNGPEETGGDEGFKPTSITSQHKTMQLAIDDETSIDLIYIKPGSFKMGRNTWFDRSIIGLLLQWDAAGAP